MSSDLITWYSIKEDYPLYATKLKFESSSDQQGLKILKEDLGITNTLYFCLTNGVDTINKIHTDAENAYEPTHSIALYSFLMFKIKSGLDWPNLLSYTLEMNEFGTINYINEEGVTLESTPALDELSREFIEIGTHELITLMQLKKKNLDNNPKISIYKKIEDLCVLASQGVDLLAENTAEILEVNATSWI